jgi:hypothetical protein
MTIFSIVMLVPLVPITLVTYVAFVSLVVQELKRDNPQEMDVRSLGIGLLAVLVFTALVGLCAQQIWG